MGTGEQHYYSLDERDLDSPREILALGAMLDVLISGGTCHDSVEVCKSEVEQDANDRLFKCEHKFRTNYSGLSWDDQTLETMDESSYSHNSAIRSILDRESSFEKVEKTSLASASDDDSGVVDQQVIEERVEQPSEQTLPVSEQMIVTPESSPQRRDACSFQEEATSLPTPPSSPTSMVATLAHVEQVATRSEDDMEIEVGTLGIIPFMHEEGFEIQKLAMSRRLPPFIGNAASHT
jgi:hypothetical protein